MGDCLCGTSARIDTAFSLGSITPLEEGYYKEKEKILGGNAQRILGI